MELKPTIYYWGTIFYNYIRYKDIIYLSHGHNTWKFPIAWHLRWKILTTGYLARHTSLCQLIHAFGIANNFHAWNYTKWQPNNITCSNAHRDYWQGHRKNIIRLATGNLTMIKKMHDEWYFCWHMPEQMSFLLLDIALIAMLWLYILQIIALTVICSSPMFNWCFCTRWTNFLLINCFSRNLDTQAAVAIQQNDNNPI